jgi:PilZ domain
MSIDNYVIGANECSQQCCGLNGEQYIKSIWLGIFMDDGDFFSNAKGEEKKTPNDAGEPKENKAQGKQKRVHKRAPCSWRARLVTQKKEQIFGRACNISLGGVSVELPVSFKNGERLYLEVSMMYKSKQLLLKAVGEVIYSIISRSDSGEYQLGFKYMTDMAPYTTFIEQYVNDKVEE